MVECSTKSMRGVCSLLDRALLRSSCALTSMVGSSTDGRMPERRSARPLEGRNSRPSLMLVPRSRAGLALGRRAAAFGGRDPLRQRRAGGRCGELVLPANWGIAGFGCGAEVHGLGVGFFFPSFWGRCLVGIEHPPSRGSSRPGSRGSREREPGRAASGEKGTSGCVGRSWLR